MEIVSDDIIHFYNLILFIYVLKIKLFLKIFFLTKI